MMKWRYDLTLQDYLIYQLYYYSKTYKSQKRNRIIISVPYFFIIIMGLGLFWIGDSSMGLFLSIFGLVVIIYNNFVKKKIIKRNYQSFVEKSFSQKTGIDFDVECNETEFRLRDKTGYRVLYHSDIDKVIEIPEYFYVKFIVNDYLLIPKSKLEDESGTRAFFQVLCHRLNKDYSDEMQWKW